MIVVASMNPAVLVHAPCCSPCATATFLCCMYVSHKQLLLAAASAAAAAHQLPCSSFEVLSCLGVPVWWVPWRFLTRRKTRTRIFQNPNSASVRRHKYPPQHRRRSSSLHFFVIHFLLFLARSLARSICACFQALLQLPVSLLPFGFLRLPLPSVPSSVCWVRVFGVRVVVGSFSSGFLASSPLSFIILFLCFSFWIWALGGGDVRSFGSCQDGQQRSDKPALHCEGSSLPPSLSMSNSSRTTHDLQFLLEFPPVCRL